jgi:hypothetical protein
MHVLFESQYDLGLEVSSFHNIETPALAFFWQIVYEDDNNEEQELSYEEYQSDPYKQERFTDANATRYAVVCRAKLRNTYAFTLHR